MESADTQRPFANFGGTGTEELEEFGTDPSLVICIGKYDTTNSNSYKLI